MKTTRKYIAALVVIAAGSVFYGSLPAQAKGIELDQGKIVLRHKDDRGHMPPPPSQRYRPGDHRPPTPPSYRPGDHRPPQEHFEPRREPPRPSPRRETPPPPPPHHR